MFGNKIRRKQRTSNVRVSRRARRLQERHVLDTIVKSRRETQLQRIAQIKLGLKFVGAIVILSVLFVLGRNAISTALYNNPEFSLAEIELRTNGTMTHGQILKEAGLNEGDNLLQIKIENIRTKLEALPRVRHARVERRLPRGISIFVDERQAVAWLAGEGPGIRAFTSNGGFLLDSKGVVFECDALLTEYMSLPVINLHRVSYVTPGVSLGLPQVTEALRLIELVPNELVEYGVELAELDLVRDYCIRAKFRNHTEVIFKAEDVATQIERLKRILIHAKGSGKQLAEVNLIPTRNTPVKWFEGNGRPPYPQRTRSLPPGVVRSISTENGGISKPANSKSSQKRAGVGDSDLANILKN